MILRNLRTRIDRIVEVLTRDSNLLPSSGKTKKFKDLLSRVLKELPLVFVCLLLIWCNYSLSISLTIKYLISTRKLYLISISILIPFQFSWILTILSLIRCVSTGPGWVRSNQNNYHQNKRFQSFGRDRYFPPNPNDFESNSYDLENQNLNRKSYNESLRLNRFKAPSSQEKQSNGQSFGNQSDYKEEEDEEEGDEESQSRPLLASSSSSSSSSNNRNRIQPKPSRTNYQPNLSNSKSSNLYPNDNHPSFENLGSRFQTRSSASPGASSSSVQIDLSEALAQSPISTGSNLQADSDQSSFLMCKSDGSKRFCRKCQIFKADRAHHCSSCGRCALRMDHHCPWLGGRCVGLKNHKYFILFLIWSSLTSLLAAIGAIRGLMDYVNTDQSKNFKNQSQLAPLNWAFLVLVGALFGMVLTGFTFYHLYLISVNRTTIENMERSLRVRPDVKIKPKDSNLIEPNHKNNLRRSSNEDDRNFEDRMGGRQSSNLKMVETRRKFDEDRPRTRQDELDEEFERLRMFKSDDKLTRSERMKLEDGSTKLNVYDLGSKSKNFREIFGNFSPWWQWPFPFEPIGISDGYKYKINEENLIELKKLTTEIRTYNN